MFIEIQMAELVFYLILEKKKYLVALKKYIKSTELKNYYVSTKTQIVEPIFYFVLEQKEYLVKYYLISTEI